MIKNARQYGITRSRLERFRAALDELKGQPSDEWTDLEVATLEGQIFELEQQLTEYDGLKDGTVAVGVPHTVADLPRLLIRQRIALGLSQRDLADRLGLKEQQVQRYEFEDWATANLSRLGEAAAALDLAIQGDGQVGTSGFGADTHKDIARALAKHGVSKNFLERRLKPGRGDGLAEVVDLTARLSRIYGWTPSELISGSVGPPEPVFAAAASFKLPRRANDEATRAYTVYSQYLALLTLDAIPPTDHQEIPSRPEAMRQLVLEHHEEVTFASVLDTSWRLGVPVLPLADPGAFHAVLWRTAHRNVIVLKQLNRSASRWVFDLLHELRHATEQPDEDDYVVIEDEDTDRRASAELAANRYAGEVLLDGRAVELANEAVERAANSIPRLKSVVPDLAAESGVTTADLANYLAHRLSLQGLDWWGTAQNLQDMSVDPWALARRRYLAECDLSRLAPLDRELLLQALQDHDG